ncbi:MAG: transcriptional regulator [Proteobacteria bacterium]|jgi:DNA-binding transcriptional ArsR family regulator|nr:MAG: transcriptional regulator [Pseudomonadota bacterium]
METKSAIAGLSALANDTRLAAFRLLVQAGPAGMAAGELARRLAVRPNTLTAALTILSHADLVVARRAGRSVIYAVRYETMRALLAFMTENCCAGSSA